MNKQGVRLGSLLAVVDAILLLAAYALSQSGEASWFASGVSVLLAVLASATTVTTMLPARRSLVARPDRGGVGLTNSPVLAGLLVALLVAFLLFPVSLAVAWAAGGDRPVTAAGPLVLLAVAVVGALPIAAGLVRGRYRLGGLVLTPNEVSYESFLRTHTLAWEQVRGVVRSPTMSRLEILTNQAPSVTGPRLRAGERPLRSEPVEQLNVPTGLLRTDAERLRALIEFYRAHPRDRHELGDGTLTAGRGARS